MSEFLDELVARLTGAIARVRDAVAAICERARSVFAPAMDRLVEPSDVQIGGVLRGDVAATIVEIEVSGVVHGAIHADYAIIHGRVIGSIRAHRVELHATSHVEGEIWQESLCIKAGAYFEGACHYDCPPAAEDVAVVEAVTTPEQWRARLAG
jgi:cytoskeletal protein CcmA (bactofilin family)